MLFRIKEVEIKKEIDSYEKIKEIVTAILLHELPEHSSRHHLLYTANTKLEEIRNARDYHRKHTELTSQLGQFHQRAYDHALRESNQLYTFIRAYMHLSSEQDREHYNHTFRFYKEKISRCYEQYKEKNNHLQNEKLEAQFWEALKQDVLPMLSQFE
ncbi:hypothetical protein [Lysinibacillus sp. 54212]|uniref:hypothetical protein n=1 Tax=Lysinibacillus sp. 54212 TaxID=3119829 RepID=UPI002FCB2283